MRHARAEAMSQAGLSGMRGFVGTLTPEPRHYQDWQICVEHATLATYFLDRLVFSRWPRWCQRLGMKYFPNDLDQHSAVLLNTGALAAAAPNAKAVPAATA